MRGSWWQMLLFAAAGRAAVGLLVAPFLAMLVRLFLAGEGREALSDEEILYFFLTPVGLAGLLLVGGFALGAALIEQGGFKMRALDTMYIQGMKFASFNYWGSAVPKMKIED